MPARDEDRLKPLDALGHPATFPGVQRGQQTPTGCPEGSHIRTRREVGLFPYNSKQAFPTCIIRKDRTKGPAVSFRDNLQHLRAERNMTQEQLAMLLGVSRQSVTKWEAERSYPEMDKLLKICQLFDCTLDDLVQGDLTGRYAPEGATQAAMPIPDGPPQDICGYDEHQRMLAWKVPTGIASILLGIAIGFFFEGSFDLGTHNGNDVAFIMFVLLGVLVGLVFLIPAGMRHNAFVKAHPFIEDFYTESDKEHARTTFTRGLIGGIACIFVGICLMLMLEPNAEQYALFFLMLFIALGVWNIIHYGMLLGRTNVAEYNKSAADELEIEDIANAQISQSLKDELYQTKRRSSKTSAVCGVIMIAATIVGLVMLFAPLDDPTNWVNGDFEPLGTTAAWFWVAWIVGGLLCVIAAMLIEAFGKHE